MSNFFDEQLASHGGYGKTTEALYRSFKRRFMEETTATTLTVEQQVRLAVLLKMQEREPHHVFDSMEQTEEAVSIMAAIVLQRPYRRGKSQQ